MQRAMDRLSDFVERRRRIVALVWLVTLLAALPFAARQTEHLTSGGFGSPGSQSANVDASLGDFPGAQREGLGAVLALDPRATPADVRAAIARLRTAADRTTAVRVAASGGRPRVQRAGGTRVVLVPLQLSGTRNQSADQVVNLRKDLVGGSSRNVDIQLTGQQALWAGMQDVTKEDLAKAEFTGFPVVLIILLAVFGSFAAAVLPLALGFAAVMLTGAEVYFLSQATEMSIFVTNVASMIGIGVAVDYSLFVLARYREEIHRGATEVVARRTAMRTSGIAVAFSGVTVMISLAGLFLVNSQTLRSMAMGAIVVVAVSILGAITLLPALMRMLGRRTYSRGRIAMITGLLARARTSGRRRRGRSDPDRPGFWDRWTGRVSRRPGLAAALSALAMLAIAYPALSLKFGNGALDQFPKGNATRVAAERAAQVTGPGAGGPALVMGRLKHGSAADPRNRAAVERFVAQARRDPGVASVAKPAVSRDGRSVLVAVTPRRHFESDAADAMLSRLRSSSNALSSVARVDVGGPTAFNRDFIDLISGSMWKILLFVLAFSYLVLLVLLRSVFLPLKAVVMNVLSVAAAYGVLVMTFQWGWFDGLLGYNSLGYIQAMTPPFLLAVVFGLSMDYEVFLLTRIRERYEATGDTQRAVAEGLSASARTITSAAAIMVAVFAVFAMTGVPSIKEIGLGLSVAIALDATLVRLVLVPATMEIMGRWNWWLPAWLDRILPHTSFEASEPPPGSSPPAAGREATAGAAAG
ncbi:MAG: putative drug exporter of the superfamily [Thermoleophilaceae bacterium]|nr:putative drug exporter of the superfamily [Thermoleophilaceae bacterium]